ncbi:MAG TPA: response regulator [Gemmatimonadales bacterium]|nr:response regulator [Gemmatimonadales bacterium]
MSDRPARSGLPLALLVSDQEEGVRWLRHLLESEGYAILRERTGWYALERACSIEPDVIIVAGDLPDQQATELCGALRADPRLAPSTPILLSVAVPVSREQRRAALRAGAWECLAPPHDAEEILLKINAYARARMDAARARAEGLFDPATGLYNLRGLARRARELGALAFRQHGPLACVVVAVDAEPPDAAPVDDPATTTNLVVGCIAALRSSARVSDVVGRVAPAEFAVLAPGTDVAGARRLAERLAQAVQGSAAAASTADTPARPRVRVRCGYDAVANIGYAPIEPVDLLVRASAAVRTGKPEVGTWLRRFAGEIGPAPPQLEPK